MPIKTLAIINPISGTNSKKNLPEMLDKYLDKSKFDLKIEFTKHGGHATELTKYAINEGFQNVIAIGGDGTMNEVAKALVHTDVSLGIIPSGSGNGLARHLHIPLKTELAIKALNNAQTTKMDAGSINDHYFFCTAGLGFDAQVGHAFAKAGKRGLQTYVKTSIAEFFNYKPQIYKVSYQGKVIESKAYLLTFANTSQFGNNAFIAPEASVKDGLIDTCILKPFPMISALGLARRLFSGKIHRSRYMQTIKSAEFIIERENEGVAHIDGEPILFGKKIEVKNHPSCLKLLLPASAELNF